MKADVQIKVLVDVPHGKKGKVRAEPQMVTVSAEVFGCFAAHAAWRDPKHAISGPRPAGGTWSVSCIETGLSLTSGKSAAMAKAIARELGEKVPEADWRAFIAADARGPLQQLVADIVGSFAVMVETRRQQLELHEVDGKLAWCVKTGEPLPIKVAKAAEAGGVDWRGVHLRTLVTHAPRYVDQLIAQGVGGEKLRLAVERMRKECLVELHAMLRCDAAQADAADGDCPAAFFGEDPC